MPPKKRAPPANDYSSDGGFVANDSEDERPKSKKAKTGAVVKRSDVKASKRGVVGGGFSEGEDVFWEVSAVSALGLGCGENTKGERVRRRGKGEGRVEK